MIKKVKAELYICDAKGCDFSTLIEKDQDLPDGFYGTVSRKYPNGHTGKYDWYAHTEVCIEPAVLFVIEKGIEDHL